MTVFMDCVGIDPGNTYLWINLAGLFIGGGFSFLLSPAGRRKPAVFTVLLSISILCLLAAFIVAGFSLDNYNLKLLWLGVSVVVGYLCLLFWKAAGIPVLFLSVIFISGVWYSFDGWSCAGTGAEICRFRTISETEDFVRIQYEDSGVIPEINKIQGGVVYPLIDIISIPDYFFILTKSKIYRFYGFGAEPDENIARDSDAAEFILNKITSLPGFILHRGNAEAIHFSPSLEYLLIFGANGQPEIKRQI